MIKDYNKYLEYKNGKLFLEDVSLEELAKEFGTPLYIYSASHIRDKAKAYKDAFKDADFHYALKANGNLSIIKLLKDEGFGADIVSGGELRKVLKAGIDPSKIVYAGVGKTVEELKMAIEAGIKMFNVESSMELDILNDIAKSLGKKANIAIRVNPDVDPKTHPYISTGMKKSKFGVDIKTAYKEYQYAKSLKHLNIVGIHCHIGSQLLDVSPYIEASEKVRELYDQLIKDDFDIKYIDIGGGLGIKYKPEEQEPHPNDLKEAVYPAFKDIKAKLCLEPGRSMVGNAGILITQVQFLKDKGHKHFVIVDAGMNDLIRPSIYGAYHQIIPTHKKREESYIKTDIVGPICETGDFLAQDREIPMVERGDYLAVLSAGAYGFSMSSNYNIRPRSGEVLVEKGKYRLIRSRETYDYIDYDEAIL
ncbi:diaminopimelate decarboxylase [Hydrogenobaculum acidophilum]